MIACGLPAADHLPIIDLLYLYVEVVIVAKPELMLFHVRERKK